MKPDMIKACRGCKRPVLLFHATRTVMHEAPLCEWWLANIVPALGGMEASETVLIDPLTGERVPGGGRA